MLNLFEQPTPSGGLYTDGQPVYSSNILVGLADLLHLRDQNGFHEMKFYIKYSMMCDKNFTYYVQCYRF